MAVNSGEKGGPVTEAELSSALERMEDYQSLRIATDGIAEALDEMRRRTLRAYETEQHIVRPGEGHHFVVIAEMVSEENEFNTRLTGRYEPNVYDDEFASIEGLAVGTSPVRITVNEGDKFYAVRLELMEGNEIFAVGPDDMCRAISEYDSVRVEPISAGQTGQ